MINTGKVCLTLEILFQWQVETESKVITNDDVLGDAIPYDQQDAMRHYCYQLLDLPLPVVDPQSIVTNHLILPLNYLIFKIFFCGCLPLLKKFLLMS